jgi:selenoprotein B, glycine/betaine/sarcosine/D-proline reductase family
MKKAVVYTNQFFGQIGGEDKAYLEPEIRQGPVGAANLFNDRIDDTKIEATIICGDNYYAENMEKASGIICCYIEKIKPDIFIAGPAFNAGRFGMACGDICAVVEKRFNIPTITGLYDENPAVEIYKDKTYIIRTGKSAADMRNSTGRMINMANKLIKGDNIGLPDADGYIPKGIRINVFKDKTGAERALDMLVKKLNGEAYKSEIPIPVYNSIKPAGPIKDIGKAKICLVTSGGIVPNGNPDRLPAATAKFYCKYDICNLDYMEKGGFESVHAGYDPVYANDDPNRVVPLDVMRKFEKEGRIGSLNNYLYVTTGNSTSVADADRMGKSIADELLKESIDGVILTST